MGPRETLFPDELRSLFLLCGAESNAAKRQLQSTLLRKSSLALHPNLSTKVLAVMQFTAIDQTTATRADTEQQNTTRCAFSNRVVK